jgi:hypothetical protein
MSRVEVKSKKKQLLIPVAAGLVLIFTGCFDNPRRPPVNPLVNNIPGQQPLQPGQTPTTGTPAAPSANLPAVFGTYYGTLFQSQGDGNMGIQPYELRLSSGGQYTNYVYATFASSGEIGNLGFSSYMEIGLKDYQYNGRLYFSFLSSIQNQATLSASPVALLLLVALGSNGSGLQYDPTQSSIYIKDCGFSQACTNFSQDVWFGADLGKR